MKNPSKAELQKKVSKDAITAAETLLKTKAWLQVVEPIVTGYQKAILAEINGTDEGNAKYAKIYPDGVYVPKLVIEPNEAYHLSDANAEIYFAACQKAAKIAKFTVADECCPLLCAESDIVKARWSLITHCANITGLTPESVPPSKMEELSEICLKLLISLGFTRSAEILTTEFAVENPYYKG